MWPLLPLSKKFWNYDCKVVCFQWAHLSFLMSSLSPLSKPPSFTKYSQLLSWDADSSSRFWPEEPMFCEWGPKTTCDTCQRLVMSRIFSVSDCTLYLRAHTPSFSCLLLILTRTKDWEMKSSRVLKAEPTKDTQTHNRKIFVDYINCWLLINDYIPTYRHVPEKCQFDKQ